MSGMNVSAGKTARPTKSAAITGKESVIKEQIVTVATKNKLLVMLIDRYLLIEEDVIFFTFISQN